MIKSIDIDNFKSEEINLYEKLNNDLKDRFQAEEDGPCHIFGNLQKKDNNSLLINLNIEQNLLFTCFKCLDLVKFSLLGSFKEEITLDDEYIVDGKFLLYNYIKDNVILIMPSSIYCKEDCKGICQECGKNKNIHDCNCLVNDELQEDINNPFSRLQDLIK